MFFGGSGRAMDECPKIPAGRAPQAPVLEGATLKHE